MYGFGGSVWQNLNGNRNCPYLNRNGSKRNLNLNWIDNDFNEICRFAAVRNSLRLPWDYLRGVSFWSCLRQPPSIFPTSASGSDTRVYFLLSKNFSSQAVCKKNFVASSFMEAWFTRESF